LDFVICHFIWDTVISRKIDRTLLIIPFMNKTPFSHLLSAIDSR